MLLQGLVEESKNLMSSRDAILGRIRTALAGEPEAALPPVTELWPGSASPPLSELADQFLDQPGRVQGEGARCGSLAELQQRMLEINQQSAISPGAPGQSASRIGVVDHPLCRATVARVEPTQLAWMEGTWDRDRIASLPVSVLPAEFLLADTGTAVVVARSAAERLLCYLPTIAVLVAQTNRLAAHMSDIWDQVTRTVADPAMRGEIVLVTGPSRTADIEKKLVLGAHGPKRLIVLLADQL